MDKYNGERVMCPRCEQEFPRLDNYFHRGGTGHFDYCWSCQQDYKRDYKRGYNKQRGTYFNSKLGRMMNR